MCPGIYGEHGINLAQKSRDVLFSRPRLILVKPRLIGAGRNTVRIRYLSRRPQSGATGLFRKHRGVHRHRLGTVSASQT